jgi:hypothetical protein
MRSLLYMGRRLIKVSYYTPFRPFDCSALRTRVLIFLSPMLREMVLKRLHRVIFTCQVVEVKWIVFSCKGGRP